LTDLVEPWPGVLVPTGWRYPADVRFDADRAEHAVRFFSRFCRHVKGEWYGKRFDLSPWQAERIIRPVFGLLRPDGTRLIRTVFVEIPRKNGKSLLASGVALKLLFADAEMGAEIYSAAVDKEQAGIVFGVASDMVDLEPRLNARAQIYRGNNRRIVATRSRGFYRVVSADARRSHGFNSHGVIGDELHAWPGDYTGSLLEVLATSTGSRRQPLIFLITTAGFDQESLCYREYRRAKQVESGVLEAPNYLPVIYEPRDPAAWLEESTWHEANPGLGTSISLEYFRESAARARETPADENAFKRLHLNIWTEQRIRWIPIEAWDACAGELDPEALRTLPCTAGLDLSSREDTTAFVAAWELPDGRIAIRPMFWIPEVGAVRRESAEHIPYRAFATRGLCELTPGETIDYGRVLAWIVAFSRAHNLREVGFDPWNAERFRQELEAAGMTMIEFRQGWRSMAEPTASFQRLFRSRQLLHDGNDLLRFQASNTAVIEDPAGNLKPAKNLSGDRIDGIVAAIMATWLRLTRGELDADAVLGPGT
jgi:phage terminase large subunit-like protein